MEYRYVCQRCVEVYRKNKLCAKCGSPLFLVNIPHTIFGVMMYVLAAIGGIMILLAFIVNGYLALFSLVPIIIAVLMNILDDREIDKIAKTKIQPVVVVVQQPYQA